MTQSATLLCSKSISCFGMAAPGAVVISKMIYPQTEAISDEIQISRKEIGSNFLTALSSGTSEGVRMAVNVAAMLLVFIAMIAL